MNAFIFLPMIALMMIPAAPQKKFKDLGIDEVRYSFHDSSVPPPYHRSYTITLKADQIRIVVNSYGDIIADRQFTPETGSLSKITDLLDESAIKNVKEKEDRGCTGGNGETLECLKEGNVVFKGSAWYCGGKTTGNLGGKISSVKEAMIALIPEFSKVIDRAESKFLSVKPILRA